MAGKTKKRRFGKRLTLFREAVKKLHPDHRVPHVVTVLGVAMGLTEEKINEEIGLAAAMFGHLVGGGRTTFRDAGGVRVYTDSGVCDQSCEFVGHPHTHHARKVGA